MLGREKISIVFLVLFLGVFSLTGFTQKDNRLSFDIGLPQTYKGFFYLYNGIIEVGGAYHLNPLKNFHAGGSMHINFLNRNPETGRSIMYKPKLSLYYTINIDKKFQLIPTVAGGYSFVSISNKEFDYSEIQSGLSISPELKLSWKNDKRVQYYLFGRYDFIYLNEDLNFTHLEYYRRVNMTCLGLGIFIHPKQD
jgi:hypothetical protein